MKTGIKKITSLFELKKKRLAKRFWPGGWNDVLPPVSSTHLRRIEIHLPRYLDEGQRKRYTSKKRQIRVCRSGNNGLMVKYWRLSIRADQLEILTRFCSKQNSGSFSMSANTSSTIFADTFSPYKLGTSFMPW